MKAEYRTKYAMMALGWQGGTVHDLCREIECSPSDFLYDPIEGVSVMNSTYTQGWFAYRTCSKKYLFDVLAPKYKGDVQFWLGVAAGAALDE